MTAAVVFDRYGPPEVLRLAEVDLPAPAPGEVRVRVAAAGVNPIDAKVRRGDFAGAMPASFPQSLGNEFAGVVDAVGEGVSGVVPGQDVLGFTAMAAYAEHVVVPAEHLARNPETLPWKVAGALSAVGQMAHHAVEELGIGPGDTFLVHAAAGGVGTVAVQLARRRGATVIGTASARNHDYLRSLGAIPIAYGPGLGDRLTDQAPNGVDAVLDAVGGGAVEASLSFCARADRIGTNVDDAAAELHGVRRLRGARSAGVLAMLARLAADGDLELPIHLSVPLPEAARAHEEIETGHVRGKVVLTVS